MSSRSSLAAVTEHVPGPRRRVQFVPHTHWDREWYEPFEVFRARLLDVLDEALGALERDPRLCLLLDGQSALCSDYLALMPEERPRLAALVAAGRLEVGPFFTQPDTLLADGETLLRNLLLGLDHARALGGSLRVAYLPDPFGHAAQLPQLCRLAGLQGAVLWRGVGPERLPHHFRWRGPDGSSVLTAWLAEGYGTLRLLPSAAPAFASALDHWLERQAPGLGELPVLMPVGDDHAGICEWLPAALQRVEESRPDLEVVLGGLGDHFARIAQTSELPTAVHDGELRSGTFAAVLPGVASARQRGKQAADRISRRLLRNVEPLWAWAALAAARSGQSLTRVLERPGALWARAWHLLIENQAHDSAAGCGSDASHDDVMARFRWAEQLALGLEDRLLQQLGGAAQGPRLLRTQPVVEVPGEVLLFHPGPSAPLAQVELEVLGPAAELWARGGDGVARPVQCLSGGATSGAGQPLFEGEFGPDELRPFVEGLDPTAPLFGLFVSAVELHDGELAQEPTLVVRLASVPAAADALEASRPRISRLLERASRVRIVVRRAEEGSGEGQPSRVVALVGPAPEAGFVRCELVRQPTSSGAEATASPPPVEVTGTAELPGLQSGDLQVSVNADGTLQIQRAGAGTVRAHRLVDEGDRGDLYHFDAVEGDGGVTARLTAARVLEAGPWRGRLELELELDLPVGLAADRASRSSERRLCPVRSWVTVHAGEPRVEITSWFDNTVRDHRLRALVDLAGRAERLDAEQAFCVVSRPVEVDLRAVPAQGHGVERPARTAPHRTFVDVSGGGRGCALLCDGLLEHELLPSSAGGPDGAADRPPALALTLLRAVGWLARGDLQAMTHAPGPVVPTPHAQEPGEHRFDYAVLVHAGDRETAGVAREARRFLCPPMAVGTAGAGGVAGVPPGTSLVEVTPAQVMVSAVHPETEGLMVRVLNTSAQPTLAQLQLPDLAFTGATLAAQLGPVSDGGTRRTLALQAGGLQLPLQPYELATVYVSWPRPGST